MKEENVDEYLNSIEERIQDIICKPVFIYLEDCTNEPVEEDHISTVCSQHFNNLLRLMAKENDDLKLAQINRLISSLCGQGSCGSISRLWVFKNVEDITLRVDEPDYASAGLGWKTWGGSILLSKLLISDISSIRKLNPKVVVELGCGTGLAGMILDKLLETADDLRQIYLTDYQETVLQNVDRNINQNGLKKTEAKRLDWFNELDLAENWQHESCDFVMAADVVYEDNHAIAVPKVSSHLLSENGICWIVSPQRPQYNAEIHLFEQEMLKYFDNTRSKRIWQRDILSNSNEEDDENDRMCRDGVWYTFNEYRRKRGDNICLYSNMSIR